MNFNFNPEKIDALIQLAIEEDIGTGDITTENLIPEGMRTEGNFVAKESGIVAGLPVVEYFFFKLDKGILLRQEVKEGAFVSKGDVIASIKGSAKTLLSGERIALNFLQRLSGIATLTAQFVERIKPLKTHIMDTRKTIPGWRYLEKYAVAVGGGVNHRMGLYDQALVKDNHLDILKVETGLKPVSTSHISIAQLEEAVKMVKNWKPSIGQYKPLTEASGNTTLENVHLVAQTGVDRISVGAITHSAKALDISLGISGQ